VFPDLHPQFFARRQTLVRPDGRKSRSGKTFLHAFCHEMDHQRRVFAIISVSSSATSSNARSVDEAGRAGDSHDRKIRLVYAGTSSFAVPILQSLFEEEYPIAGVVTQPDRPAGRGHTLQPPPVKLKAMELRLPVHQPPSLKNEDARRLFETLAPEILVVVAYGKLLPGWLLELPRYGAVNIHGSLLPRYRGAAPIQWAMANGDPETGVCTMRLDQGLDTGPVYLRRPNHRRKCAGASGRLATWLWSDKTDSGRYRCGHALTGPQDHTRDARADPDPAGRGSSHRSLPARAIHNRTKHSIRGQTRTGFRDGLQGF
jgi:hypothetical protein